jgi:hypothetical protein
MNRVFALLLVVLFGCGSAESSEPTTSTSQPECTCPAGPEGPAGTQGPKGNPGDQGPMGPQGVQGPKGSDGPQGQVGPVGPQGPAGSMGPQGAQGVAGPQGPAGVIKSSGLYRVLDSVYVTTSGSFGLTAACHDGDILLTGGCRSSSGNANVRLITDSAIQSSTSLDLPASWECTFNVANQVTELSAAAWCFTP